MRYRHVAVLVGADLRAAEEYYARLLGLQAVLREAPLERGGPEAEVWGQFPLGKTWDDAEAAGVEIGMSALQRDELILALFRAEPTGESVYAVGMVMESDEIERVADRLEDETVESRDDGWLSFVDACGLRCQLPDVAPFRGAVEARGLWLDV